MYMNTLHFCNLFRFHSYFIHVYERKSGGGWGVKNFLAPSVSRQFSNFYARSWFENSQNYKLDICSAFVHTYHAKKIRSCGEIGKSQKNARMMEWRTRKLQLPSD